MVSGKSDLGRDDSCSVSVSVDSEWVASDDAAFGTSEFDNAALNHSAFDNAEFVAPLNDAPSGGGGVSGGVSLGTDARGAGTAD
jgi:hypothetical protein